MKEFGYTLTEAIITVGIVGIIAALTVPNLATAYNKKTYTSSLASAINNFESAMTTMISREGVDNLFETEAWQAIKGSSTYSLNLNTTPTKIKNFMKKISNVLPLEKYEVSNWIINKLNTGTTTNTSVVRFKTKNGLIYAIGVNQSVGQTPKNELIFVNAGYYYTNKAGDVYIDVNGDKLPNRLGRDIFIFELADNGKLYAFGSKEQQYYSGKQESSFVEAKTKCKTNLDGTYCAAYLIENSYNMDY